MRRAKTVYRFVALLLAGSLLGASLPCAMAEEVVDQPVDTAEGMTIEALPDEQDDGAGEVANGEPAGDDASDDTAPDDVLLPDEAEPVLVEPDAVEQDTAEPIEPIEGNDPEDAPLAEAQPQEPQPEISPSEDATSYPLASQAESTEVTVTYVPATPIRIVKGSVEWDDYDECYCYTYTPQAGDKIKVSTDGSTKTYTYTTDTYTWLDSKGKSDWVDVQLYVRLSKAQDTLGTHKMTVDYFRNDSFVARGSVSFQLVESPIASMSYKVANPIYLVKGKDSSRIYEYDAAIEKGGTYNKWFFPVGTTRLVGDKLTVELENGTTKVYVYQNYRHPTGGYEATGFVNADDPTDVIEPYELDYTSNQTFGNQWKSGTHSFELLYKGATARIPVKLQPQTVTKVRYVRKTSIRRKTTTAVAYTKKLGIYEASYAKRVVRYQIVFKAPTPVAGDVLKVTADGETLSYVYDAKTRQFVSKADPGNPIPRRDVSFGSLTVTPATTKTAYPCSYQGVEFSIPFSIIKAPQRVRVSSKQLVVGKKLSLGTTSTGFDETKFAYTSSRPKVATVSSKGVVTAKSIGRTKIRVRARTNVAYRASKVRTITVRVGRRNPMRVTARSTARVRRGALVRLLRVRAAKGAVRYSNVSTNATAKTFRVYAKSGKVRVPKATKKGTYTLKIRARAQGKGTYLAATRITSIKVTVR